MRCLVTIIGIGLAALLATGCVGPASAKISDAPVPEDVLAKASLAYYWQAEVELLDGETLRGLWRLDDRLYLLTTTNRLVSLNAANGARLWSVEVADPHKKDVFAPCHADHVAIPKVGGIAVLLNPPMNDQLDTFDGVIINTLSYALLIDRDSGRVKRKLDFPFAANSAGISDGHHFYVGAINGYYHAVRLSDGLLEWTMATGDMITATPQLSGRGLYVASQDGKLYATDPSLMRNRRIWVQTTDGPLAADFVVDSRGCFVPSLDYRVYAYDLVTGKINWTFRAQGPIARPIQVGATTVFQYAEQDRFYAIDLASGRKRWDLGEGRLVLGVVGSNVLVLTEGADLLVVQESLGEVAMSLPMAGLDLFVPNASGPIVYAASRTGKVVCIRPAEAGHIKPDDLKSAK